VNERPGITVRELGEQLGVDPTSLYRVIHRLESDGLVKKAGRGLEPARESTSAAPAPAASATDEAGGSTSPESDATTEPASGV
jgi:DNA-binding Lrp family transcriptional regulator